LTKGTAYLFIPPLAVWSAFIILRGRRVRLAPAIALVPAIVLILNAPFWLRNLEVFADPLGGHGGLKSQLLTLPALVSGLLRNASLHLATPSSQVNSWIHAAIVGAHQVIGIGAAEGRTTFLTLAFSEPRWSTSDYKTGNLFHLLLVCMAARACWMLPSLRKDWRLISYLLALFGAFVLFSLLLKWQPIHSRLQQPLFVLAAPAVGRILGASSDHRPALLVCAVLVAASTPWLFGTSTRPVFGPNSVFTVDRSYQYFSGRSQLRHSYAEAVDLVSSKRCANVGLVIGSDSWEYPLWPLLRRNGEAEARVEHVKCREPLTRQSDHRLVSCV